MTVDQTERTGALVYDADCGFCTRFADWSGHAVPWQELDLEAAGTTEAAMTAAAGWLIDGQVVTTGAGAIAAALVNRGGAWAYAGRALRLPVLRAVADVVYRMVARNRHRMPGGTPACSVPVASRSPRRPPPLVMGLLMAGILMAGLLTYAASNRGEQPWPGLAMPGFGYNPSNGDGTVTLNEVDYRVTMPDGRTLPITSDDLLPKSGPAPYMLAQAITFDTARAEQPAVRRWFAGQVDRSVRTRGAVSITAYVVSSTYTDDHTLVDRTTTPRVTLDLAGVR